MASINHWIGGRLVAGTSGRTAPVFNPATGEQSGIVDLASTSEVDLVVADSLRASIEWKSASLSRRAAVVFKFRELLAARAEDLASVITAEHGKVRSDAAGEVARGLENVEFATGVAQLMKGRVLRRSLHRGRRLFHSPAPRRCRGHHAV